MCKLNCYPTEDQQTNKRLLYHFKKSISGENYRVQDVRKVKFEFYKIFCTKLCFWFEGQNLILFTNGHTDWHGMVVPKKSALCISEDFLHNATFEFEAKILITDGRTYWFIVTAANCSTLETTTTFDWQEIRVSEPSENVPDPTPKKQPSGYDPRKNTRIRILPISILSYSFSFQYQMIKIVIIIDSF